MRRQLVRRSTIRRGEAFGCEFDGVTVYVSAVPCGMCGQECSSPPYQDAHMKAFFCWCGLYLEHPQALLSKSGGCDTADRWDGTFVF